MKIKTLNNVFGALMAVALSTVSVLAAGTDTWVGNSDANWNTALNWTTVGGSTPPANGDSLVFGAAGSKGASLNNDISSLTVNKLTFNSSASSFTFGGNGFTLGTGGIDASALTSGTMTFTPTIVIGNGLQKWNVGAGATLAFGALGAGADSADLYTPNGAMVIISSTGTKTTTTADGWGWRNGAVAGTGPLGPGMVIDNGNNTYDWASVGTQTAGTSHAIVAATYTTVPGGTSDAHNVRVTSNNTYSGGNASWASILVNNATLTINPTVYVDTGLILENGGTVSGGTLDANADGLYIYVPDSGTISSSIQNGAKLLYKAGPGTLILSGSDTYTGTTVIYAGTLKVDASGAINSSSGITVNGSGAKYLHTASTASTRTITQTLGTVDGTGTLGTVNVANNSANVVQNGNGGTSQLTIGMLAFSGAATVNIAQSGTAATPGVNVTGTLSTTPANGTVTINATIAGGVWTSGTTYNLINAGTKSFNLSDFTLGTVTGLGVRQGATLALSGNNLVLQITGTSDTPKWTGLDSTSWATGSTGANHNWKLITAGTATDYIQGDMVLFDDSASSAVTPGSVVISSANVSPASTTFNNSSVGISTYTVSGSYGIAGSGSLTKNGTGTLQLTEPNTYTGITAINAGTLDIGGGTANGLISSSSALSMGGGTLKYTRTGGTTQTFNGASFTGGASAVQNTVSGDTLALGALTESGGGAVIFTPTGSITTSTTDGGGIIGGWAVIDNGNNTFDWAHSGLSGVNAVNNSVSYAGPGTGNAGDVKVTSNYSAGINGTWNSLFVSGATLTVSSGNLYLSQSGIILQSSGIIAGSAPVKCNGGNFFIYVPNANSGTISTTLTGNSDANRAVYKYGPGTLSLTGNNPYTGGTVVYGGTLQVDGSSGAINSSSGITVNGSGAKYLHTATTASTRTITQTLGTVDGTGTLGTVNVANNSANVVQNGNGATSQLTIGTLAFSGAATVNIAQSGTAATPGVNVTGTLSTTPANGTVTINATIAGGVWTSGTTYNLINAGTKSFSLGDFTKGTITGLGARQNATLALSGNNLVLQITGGDTPKWTGLDSASWTTSSTGVNHNWKLITGGTATDYIDGDTVLFDDLATASHNSVSISSANVSPTLTTFGNSTVSYTVSGSYGIAAGSLTVNGGGTVNLNTPNTYSGSTTVSANSTLNLGGSLGSTAISVGSGSTLSETSGGAIGGSASLASSGSTTLAGANTYSGSTTVSAGTLSLSGSLGSTAISVGASGTLSETSAGTIGGLASLASSGTTTLAGANTYSGGTTVSAGTLNVNGSLGNTAVGVSGTLSLQNASAVSQNTVTVNSGGSLNETAANALSGSAALTVASGGTATLSKANNYSGATAVTGTLQLSDAGALASSALTLNNGSTLNLRADADTTFANNGIASISGTTTTINADQITSGGGNGSHKLTLANNFSLAASATLNVSSGSGDTLALGTISAAASSTQTINVGSGSKVTIAAMTGPNVNDAFTFTGAGNLDVLGVIQETSSARYMNLTFNQSGTATLWGSNKLKGDNTTSTYIPSVSFNSGVNVLNNNNALYAPTAPNVYLGATSGGNPTTLLLGGPTAGTEGGITISTALNNNTLVVQYGNSGTVTIGGQNTSGVNIWGCNFTLGSGANNGKSVTLLAATGGEVDFTGAFLKNGSDTTAGITVGDATHGGTVKITGANTYGGGTTVSGGKLLVNNTSGSGTGSGAVTVQNTATLGGSGTISGAVTVNSGGTLSPGVTTIGTLTINNNLTLSGVANFRLNKTGSTLTSDQVAGATSVTAGGTLNVTASGDALADGDTFTLFNVTPGSAFAVTNLPSTTSANWWTTNNFRTLIYNLWPTAGNTNFTHKKGIPVRFSVADLLARVSGATSGKTITVTSLGNPTVSGATVQTNGSLSSSSTLILYTPGSSDANDSFAYTISDGHGGSPSGTVYLTADTSTVFGQQSPQLTADGNGNIKVTFFGVPGYTYTIQRSATVDFSSPTDLITQTATTGNPVITCTDTISPSGQAYYRLKWQP